MSVYDFELEELRCDECRVTEPLKMPGPSGPDGFGPSLMGPEFGGRCVAFQREHEKCGLPVPAPCSSCKRVVPTEKHLDDCARAAAIRRELESVKPMTSTLGRIRYYDQRDPADDRRLDEKGRGDR